MSDALIIALPTITGRSLRLSLRSPDALLTALLLPVMLMVVFVYLFGGAVAIGTSYVEYVVPGVLLLCAITGASTTAVTVCQDMTGGIIDRFRSLDVPGTVMLAGHVTRQPAAQPGLDRTGGGGRGRHRLPAALGSGPAGAPPWSAAAVRGRGLVAGRGVRAGRVRARGGRHGAMFFLMFLCYASSAFVPVRTMPWWLRGFAHQPATRSPRPSAGLLLGQPAGRPAGGQLAAALAWSAGILAASVLLSMVLFRRRTA